MNVGRAEEFDDGWRNSEMRCACPRDVYSENPYYETETCSARIAAIELPRPCDACACDKLLRCHRTLFSNSQCHHLRNELMTGQHSRVEPVFRRMYALMYLEGRLEWHCQVLKTKTFVHV